MDRYLLVPRTAGLEGVTYTMGRNVHVTECPMVRGNRVSLDNRDRGNIGDGPCYHKGKEGNLLQSVRTGTVTV